MSPTETKRGSGIPIYEPGILDEVFYSQVHVYINIVLKNESPVAAKLFNIVELLITDLCCYS